MPGLKLIIESLAAAVPRVTTLLVVCLLFFFIFAILGMNLFGGKMWGCVDGDGEQMSHLEIPDREACLAYWGETTPGCTVKDGVLDCFDEYGNFNRKLWGTEHWVNPDAHFD